MSLPDLNTRLAKLRTQEKQIRKERKAATVVFEKQLALLRNEREAIQQTHLAEYLAATRLSRRNFLNNFLRFHRQTDHLVWQKAPNVEIATLDERCRLIELLTFLPRENKMPEALFGRLGPMELFNLYTTTRPGLLQRMIRENLTVLAHRLLAALHNGWYPGVAPAGGRPFFSTTQLESRLLYQLFEKFVVLTDATRTAFVGPLLALLQMRVTSGYTAAYTPTVGELVARDASYYLYDRVRHCVTPLTSLILARTTKLEACADRVEEKFRAKHGYTPHIASPLNLFTHNDLLKLGLVLVTDAPVPMNQLVLLCDDELHLPWDHRYQLFSLKGGAPIDHYEFRQVFARSSWHNLHEDLERRCRHQTERLLALQQAMAPSEVMVIDDE